MKVYVIQAGDFCKIGFSKNPEKRLSQIATGCPIPPVLAFEADCKSPRSVEQKAHRLLHGHLAHGEWFSVSSVQARAAVELAMREEKSPPAISNKSIRRELSSRRGPWQPSADYFTWPTAASFVRFEGCSGFTRKNLAKIGVPWPPPKNWRKRLKSYLVREFKLSADDVANSDPRAWLP